MNLKDFNEILKNNNLVIVDFFATWCGPCKTMEPIIEEVAEQLKDKAAVISIDVEDSPDVATEYRIRNIPTILYFQGGELKDKSVGAMSESELLDRINKLF